jgi:Abortive infection C-terminus
VKVHLRATTIRALAGIITGDSERTPYRTGRQLDEFFGRFGKLPSWPGGSYSRFTHTESVLKGLQDTETLARIVVEAVHPTEFMNSPCSGEEAVKFLNEHLAHDELELVRDGRAWRLSVGCESSIAVAILGEPADPLTHEFIREQLAKCERKLGDGDNDGAITNARALLEAVLREVEHRVSGSPSDTKGDLLRQYKGVQKLLNLQPEREDLHESLRQMLTGLVSIVNGIAAARNVMSDAHARTYKPAPHHARLVVNAANTITDFLLASYEVQRDRGILKPGGPS